MLFSRIVPQFSIDRLFFLLIANSFVISCSCAVTFPISKQSSLVNLFFDFPFKKVTNAAFLFFILLIFWLFLFAIGFGQGNLFSDKLDNSFIKKGRSFSSTLFS